MSVLRYAADVRQAADNLRAQATRTLLTALGIVFGVGSVIGMLSIGAGAREESLRGTHGGNPTGPAKAQQFQ